MHTHISAANGGYDLADKEGVADRQRTRDTDYHESDVVTRRTPLYCYRPNLEKFS